MCAHREQIGVRGLPLRTRRTTRSWLSGYGRKGDILKDGLVWNFLVQIVVLIFELLGRIYQVRAMEGRSDGQEAVDKAHFALGEGYPGLV